MSVHSVHADRLAALQAGTDARREAAEYLAALVEDSFRDSTASLHVTFLDIDDTDAEWESRPGIDVHAGLKREFVRTSLGQPLITIDWVRNPEGSIR